VPKAIPVFLKKDENILKEKQEDEILAKTVFLSLSPFLALAMIKSSKDNQSYHL
jgi:NADPH-dependent curcumin reductase CurA